MVKGWLILQMSVCNLQSFFKPLVTPRQRVKIPFFASSKGVLSFVWIEKVKWQALYNQT